MSGRISKKRGKWTKYFAFEYSVLQEAAGANTVFTTDKAETDTPTQTLDTKNPDTLKAGKLEKIMFRFTWANAVTLDYFAFYQAAKDGDYESRMNRIWGNDEEAGALGGAADIYTKDDLVIIEFSPPRSFILATTGSIYLITNWSGAAGNVQGFIKLSGKVDQ